jgi:hypothetical protein
MKLGQDAEEAHSHWSAQLDLSFGLATTVALLPIRAHTGDAISDGHQAAMNLHIGF